MKNEEKEDKQFFMEIAKDTAQDKAKEIILDKLFDDINIKIIDGMAQINLPEPTLELLITLFKKIDKQLVKENNKGGVQR